MHTAARRGIQQQSHISIARLRSISGRRYPPGRRPRQHFRSFHQSSSHAYPRFTPRGAGTPSGHRSHRAQDADGTDQSQHSPQGSILQEIAPGQYAQVVDLEALGGPGSDGEGHSGNKGNGSNGVPKGRAGGSGSKRSSSVSKKPEGIPSFLLPDWYLENNVGLREEALKETQRDLHIVLNSETPEDTSAKTSSVIDPEIEENDGAKKSISEAENVDAEPSVEEKRKMLIDGASPGTADQDHYEINHALWKELITFISAGLSGHKQHGVGSFTAEKTHLRLHCPVNGSIYFLERLVEEASKQIGADIVKLDAQDVASFAHDYIQEGPEARTNALWTLGYDLHDSFKRSSFQQPAEMEEGEEGEEEEIDEDSSGGSPRMPASMRGVHAVPLGTFKIGPDTLSGIRAALQNSMKAFSQSSNQPHPRQAGAHQIQSGLVPFGQMQGMTPEERWIDIKLSHMLSSVIEANVAKRGASPQEDSAAKAAAEAPEASEDTSDEPLPHDATKNDAQESHRTIILIRDIKEMAISGRGPAILEKLTDKVKEKRRQGQQIMIVGITSSADMLPELTADGVESIQAEWPTSVGRTMVVTPERAGPNGRLFFDDEARRIREINIRNIVEAIARLDARGSPTNAANLRAVDRNIRERHSSFLPSLQSEPLSFHEVHRIALVALGHRNLLLEPGSDQPASDMADHIIEALKIVENSDEKKVAWMALERGLQGRSEQKERPQAAAPSKEEREAASQRKESDARLAQLRKQCNRYEKRLLNGVVNPADLRTTFEQVHAPAATVESLKTLTMLSLSRPDAFKYGVLATDRISGLLLYGPPGTGKTLLAKAVAKESGATVLEVSGSDIYNMYVGEGEKNVKAIFSLAKKLSPCVVFIDEADAIFASRGGHNRNSHRELINQFLREWDGLTETNAFIMVATNRPFDLDDAVLRRLPRRLLVDLPVEKDREAILGIHLRDEQIDPSVSLSKLASQTNLYSGSDLKNVAVAAALAAVKEETVDSACREPIANEKTSTSEDDDQKSDQFPNRRVLHQRHFDTAMEEITASISEDMSSLTAIKKFDEKYGDKRGRKKKTRFGLGSELLGDEKDKVKVRG